MQRQFSPVDPPDWIRRPLQAIEEKHRPDCSTLLSLQLVQRPLARQVPPPLEGWPQFRAQPVAASVGAEVVGGGIVGGGGGDGDEVGAADAGDGDEVGAADGGDVGAAVGGDDVGAAVGGDAVGDAVGGDDVGAICLIHRLGI